MHLVTHLHVESVLCRHTAEILDVKPCLPFSLSPKEWGSLGPSSKLHTPGLQEAQRNLSEWSKARRFPRGNAVRPPRSLGLSTFDPSPPVGRRAGPWLPGTSPIWKP